MENIVSNPFVADLRCCMSFPMVWTTHDGTIESTYSPVVLDLMFKDGVGYSDDEVLSDRLQSCSSDAGMLLECLLRRCSSVARVSLECWTLAGPLLDLCQCWYRAGLQVAGVELVSVCAFDSSALTTLWDTELCPFH